MSEEYPKDKSLPALISCHVTLAPVIEVSESPQTGDTPSRTSRDPVAPCSGTAQVLGEHTLLRCDHTSLDHFEDLSDGSGDGGVDNHHSILLSPSPRPLVSSASCPTEPSGTLRWFSHSTASRTPSTKTPNVVHYNNTKAGLQSVDKEKTEALINELSKDSNFYLNEERKALQRQRHIEGLLVKTRQYEASVRSRPEVFRHVEREVRNLEANLEQHRSFDFIYAHIDMDMFYAAVEMKKQKRINPHYAEVPLGIGSMTMLSTTNYVARQYGVRSGMPGFIGVRLCPQLVIVPTDFAAYRLESAKFKSVVREYDPEAVGLGLDEINMCLNGYLAQNYKYATTNSERFNIAERIVEECRRRITEATELTASAGIAPTPTLAKMASNYQKPNGQFSLRLFDRQSVMTYLADIPVRQVPGIGKSRESILAGIGIHTLGEVYEQRHRLFSILTRKTYEFLLSSAIGVGGMYDSLDATLPSVVGPTTNKTLALRDVESHEDDGGRKSVGQERTFYRLTSRAELQAIAHSNLRKSHKTLLEEGLLSSQVVLKVKHRSFHVKQYSKSLHMYTDDYDTLQRALDEVLLPVLDSFADFRLLGVRLEKLRRRTEREGSGNVATSTTHPAARGESQQPTLTDLFARKLGNTAHSIAHHLQPQSSTTPRKHHRDDSCESVGGSDEVDPDDSDCDLESVLIISSESLLAKGEGMMASERPGKKVKIEETVSDGSTDEDVVIVE